jgi:PAS domain S-box-containing protein
MEQKHSQDVAAEENPVEIIDSDANRVVVNEEMCELFGYSERELMTKDVWETCLEDAEVGRNFQRVLDGETIEGEVEIKTADDDLLLVTTLLEPMEISGQSYIKSTVQNVEETDKAAISKTPDASVFDDISPTELEEITQNIRVDAPDGTMNLGAIMLDLAAGHNEIEQYKKGALSLHQAIDERLEEEKKRNPDSKECEVLREVKRSAFGLYLRVQRGDEELHGERDGRYSGYFN